MENTKIKYQTYYYIPWPDSQILWEDDVAKEHISLAEVGGLFVDSEWFDQNRNSYGL